MGTFSDGKGKVAPQIFLPSFLIQPGTRSRAVTMDPFLGPCKPGLWQRANDR